MKAKQLDKNLGNIALPISVSLKKWVTAFLILCAFYSGVQAQITAGFELDGNATAVLPNPPDDWNLIFNNTHSAQVTTNVVTDLDNIFQGGGSKDDLDINNWGWTTGSVPDKDDILHGGVALYNNCQLYFFADRYATNGSANIGFWLFKSNVSVAPDGTFSGLHTIGDLLIVSEFVNGGGTAVINAYKWVGSGGSDGTLDQVSLSGVNAFAITNTTTVTSPWPYDPKTGPDNQFAPGAFFEGGIDLCNITGLDPCFTSFLIETRSSFEVNAVLKDFMNGQFNSQPSITLAGGSRCVNGPAVTLTASVTGGVTPHTYLWSPGGNTTTSIVVSPTTNTTYTFTVTGNNGCSVKATATVTVSPLPNVNAGADKTINCTTPSIALSGSSSTAGATFSWATNDGNIVSGGNTATPTVNAAGSYTLTVTSTAGCTATDVAQVTFNGTPPNVNAGADKTITCTTTSVMLNGSSSTPNVTYSWSTIGGNIVSGGNTATPTVDAAGTYILMVTNPANGCSAKDTAMVFLNNTPPNVNAGADKTLTCTTQTVTLSGSSSTAGVTFSWATNDGNIVSGGSTATPTVDAAGTYTLTVTNPVNGCTATDIAQVFLNNTTPNVNAGADMTITCTSATVTLSGSSSTAGVTYSWATNDGNIVSGGSTATPTADAAGSYTLTVTDPVNGCTAQDVAQVFMDITPPDVNAGPDQTLTCAVTQVSLSGSSSTSGVTYAWVAKNGGAIFSGANTATPVVQVPGRYVLTVTNPVNGCTAKDSADVFQDVGAPNADAGADMTITCTTTSVILNGSTSTANTTYLWTTNDGNIVSGETTLTPTVDAGGTYMLTVTNTVTACEASDVAMVILDNTPPNVNAGSDKTLTCTTTTVTLTGSSSTPGATFSWATNDGNIVSGGSTATPMVDAVGSYTLTVTNPVNGCTATDVAQVVQDIASPNVNAGADKTLTCTTTSISLSGSSSTSGATFSWATNDGNIVSGGNTATPTVDAAGIYTLTVTNPANGCTAQDIAQVILNTTPPDVNAGSDKTLTCTVTSVVLNGSSSTAGATFSWATNDGNIVSGGSTATPTVDAAGSYTLTVTDPVNGCTATDIAVVTLDETLPNVNAGPDKTLTCAVTQVNLNGSSSTPGATFSWVATNGGVIFSGENTATPLVKIPGTYVLTVTGPVNGCSDKDSADVFYDNTLPDVDAGGDMVLNCAVDTLALDGSSETPGATVAWTASAGGNIVSGANTFNPMVNMAGTYVLTVTHPTSGCTASDTAMVTLDIATPDVNAGPDTLIGCGIDTITLHGSSTANVGFNWTTIGGNIVSGANTADPMVDAAGIYILTVIDRINGCSATDTVVVNLSLQPVVDLGDDTTATFCVGHITLDAGNPGMNYLWSTGATTQTIDVSTSGIYMVTVTNDFNCSDSDTINVFIIPGTFTVDLGPDTVIVTCVDDSLVVDAGVPNAFYSWSNGETSQTITVTESGTYFVNVTDSKGCTASDAINVAIVGILDLDLGPDTTVCGCIALSAYVSGATSITWCNGSHYPTLVVCTTGLYCVTVTNGLCTVTDSIFVTVNQPPVVDLGKDTVVMMNLMLNAGNTGATFLWNTGATTQMINVTVSGTYFVMVTDANGCFASDTVNVGVINGIAENMQADFHVNAYPNPSNNGSFTLSFDIAERGNVEVRILSTLGVVVYSEKLEKFQGAYQKKISTENFASGIYVADILKGNMRSTVKIVLE